MGGVVGADSRIVLGDYSAEGTLLWIMKTSGWGEDFGVCVGGAMGGWVRQHLDKLFCVALLFDVNVPTTSNLLIYFFTQLLTTRCSKRCRAHRSSS